MILCCGAQDSNKNVIFVADGQLVTEGERHRLLDTGLYIDPVRVEDRGDYSCRGNNSGGLAWSNGTLDVTGKLRISVV